MNKGSIFIPLLFSLSIVLSACAGLLPAEEEPVTGEFGPGLSIQEQQTRTMEALWQNLEDNYIYYETSDVDWESLQETYQARIDAGLTTDEFMSLMQDLEGDLPTGTFVYQSRAERIEQEMRDVTVSEGIGAYVGFREDPKPHIVLLDVIAGSPAEKAGLSAHDSIYEIDGSPVLLEEGIGAVERVRGPSGSKVTLTVQSPGGLLRSVEVTRGKYNSTGKLQGFNIRRNNYGYLLFPPGGYSALGDDILTNLQALTTNQKLEGLILDFRIASARSTWPLEGLYTIFSDGPLGEFYNREDKQPIEVTGRNIAGSQSVPLVILVGRNTGGLPEILAAGLQMQKRAVIIGENTPGAIEMNMPFYLPDGSQAYIESTSFVLPNGEQVGLTGIVPDIEMDFGWDEVSPEDDPVLDRAIEYLEEQK